MTGKKNDCVAKKNIYICMDTLCFFIVGNQPALMRSISHRDSKVFYLWIRVRINIKMGLSKKSDNPFR